MSAADVLTLVDDAPSTERARVGRVIAGSGTQVLVMIEHEGTAAVGVSVGDVVVLGTDEKDEVCVAGITATSVPAPGGSGELTEIWIAELALYGTLGPEGFRRGISRAPGLGEPAFLATERDLTTLYGAGREGAIAVGTVGGRPGVAAHALSGPLSRGFGVFGSAGTGKSATLAVLVRALLRGRAPVRPVLIDTHGEFERSFGRAAAIVRPGAGFVPHWLLTFDELVWVLSLAGGALSEGERVLLMEAVPAARRRMMQRAGDAGPEPVLDGPIPYRVTDLISWLDRQAHADASGLNADYRRLRARLTGAGADERLKVVFGQLVATDTLAELIETVFRLSGQGPKMSVVAVGALSLGLDRLVVAVLSRLALMIGEGADGKMPLLMLLEDAERFAPDGEADEIGGLCREAVEVLSQRGAKIGVGLGLVTARPASVTRSVLRELPTAFVHRLPSAGDRDRVADALPEGGAAEIASAGRLGPRECIANGRGVPAPARYVMSELPEAAIPTARGTVTPAPGGDLVADLLERWRFAGRRTQAAASPQPTDDLPPAPPPAPAA